MSGWISILLRRCALATVWVVLGTSLIGCETPYGQAYGRSFSEHMARTVSNPEAGQDDLEAPRPDGESADTAIYKMRTNESKATSEEPPPVIDIDIGG